jgi:NADPH-dependent curcumin reductase
MQWMQFALRRNIAMPAVFWPLGAARSDNQTLTFEEEIAMVTANPVNRQWRLKSRPTGLIKTSDFELVSEPIPDLREGQFLIRNVYLSLDPAMRGWLMDRPSYVPPVQIGEIMRGLAVGVVEKSNHPKFVAGDKAQGMLGWQEYLVSSGESVTKLPETPLPLSAHLGLFGLAGLTSYTGLSEVGQPKSGETLLISGAAGSVGSLVGQIGKIKGLRVIGIAGTDEKCHWLVKELGFDAAVNYKEADYKKQLQSACPKGVDIYFENVGGEILEAALYLMNTFGRVVVCGLISQYNATEPVPGPSNLVLVITRRLRVQGFIATDYASKVKEMVSNLTQWYSSGQLKYRVDIVRGLEAAPAAINKLFDGSNHGKLMVEVSDPTGAP